MACLCKKESHLELLGIPYDPLTIPRPCWLYANDYRYKALFDGKEILSNAPTPKPTTDANRFGNETEIVPITRQVKPHAPKPPSNPAPPPPAKKGPGGHLEQIITELGLTGWSGCPCASRARQMDAWGVGGCKANRDVIIGWLKEAQAHLTWTDRLKVVKKLAFKVSWLDPIGSILDEAIQRAV